MKVLLIIISSLIFSCNEHKQHIDLSELPIPLDVGYFINKGFSVMEVYDYGRPAEYRITTDSIYVFLNGLEVPSRLKTNLDFTRTDYITTFDVYPIGNYAIELVKNKFRYDTLTFGNTLVIGHGGKKLEVKYVDESQISERKVRVVPPSLDSLEVIKYRLYLPCRNYSIIGVFSRDGSVIVYKKNLTESKIILQTWHYGVVPELKKDSIYFRVDRTLDFPRNDSLVGFSISQIDSL